MNEQPSFFPKLKHQFDTHEGANPFDMTTEEEIFFYDNDYSCLGKEIKDFYPFFDTSKVYVVYVLHRRAIIQDGVVLKHFPKNKDLRYKQMSFPSQSTVDGDVFFLLSNKEQITTYKNPLGEEIIERDYEMEPINTANRPYWNDYEECLAYAIAYSKESSETLMVAQIVWEIDRHLYGWDIRDL